MNLEIIEHHQQQVLEAFSRGEFDQIEIIGEADEREFFELCFREKLLARLAASMPTARKKEEVPLWFELAATRNTGLSPIGTVRNSRHRWPFRWTSVLWHAGQANHSRRTSSTKRMQPSSYRVFTYS